jgi:hypothetical protein
MAKRGRPRHSDVRKHLLAAIIQQAFDRHEQQSLDRDGHPPKKDSTVEAAADDLSKLVGQYPARWRGLPCKKRSIYSHLKEFRKQRKLRLLQKHKWRLNSD